MVKQLMKGNEAVVHGALLGGATHFFGYPITPASEIAHAAADLFPRTGRHFLQAESEVSAINMIYGAAGAGVRVMTASSGPGISLMAEGISYIAGAELPCVIVDVQRAGPGLGNIWPEQSDYNAVIKGGGHGNYHNVVLAPNSAQEMCDFTYKAFGIADDYRVTVFILSDAYIGQMMEPVELPSVVLHGKPKEWALSGDAAGRPNLISSIVMSPKGLSDHNWHLHDKYDRLEDDITDWEEVRTDDAEVLLVAYGITARISLSVVHELRRQGIKAGLLRPKTLFPFPRRRLRELAESGHLRHAAVVELSDGMMADDVQLALPDSVRVHRLNWLGGEVPTTRMVMDRVAELIPASTPVTARVAAVRS
ncbi:MAG: 3-methyl-2-oxobutanoate dehydrogenase subunit VorB [Spirochaetales bacterium]|nr:MAG: 3-methyl-2-oxobutanoate dehydrogenase subunit VorB [Spirochaetales bacterium]